MNMNFQDFGFTKATQHVRLAINRLWLQNFLTFFLRYSGFFLLGSIVYLHFIFDSINHNHLKIELWMLGYLGYLIVLELLNHKKVSFYDSSWFVIFRAFLNILFISWLMNAAPPMRGILAFAYMFPFVLLIVYFPQNSKLLLLFYGLSILGIIISNNVADLKDKLTFWQMLIVTLSLATTIAIMRKIYSTLLNVPEYISHIINRLQGTLDLTDIVDKISEGAMAITDADGVFILIVDPEDRSYISHKVIGLSLSPLFEMDELINQCYAIQRGQRYGKDDLDETGDKAYFSQFFTPTPRAILVEPILNPKNNVVGLIMTGGHSPAQFDNLKKKYLQKFCEGVSVVIETNLVYRKARLSLLGRKNVAEQLLEVEEESEIVKILVEQASTLIGNTDGCVFHRYESDPDCLVAKGGVKPSDVGKLVPWVASYSDPTNLGNNVMHMGEGFAGNALKKRNIVVSGDVKKDPRFIKSAQTEKLVSLMSAPIIDPESELPIGTISIHSKQRAAFTTEDQSTLLYLSKQGAISIARVQKSEEWRLRGGILKEIFASVLEISFEASENMVAQKLVEIARRVLPFGMVRLRLYDPVTMELISVSAVGYPKEDQEMLIGSRLPLIELEKFLISEYAVERSFLIPSDAPGWQEFAEQHLYIPKTTNNLNATWNRYDAFFTPLFSENGDLLGYIAWDQPENNLRPPKRIVEAVGAFASMAGWSIDLARAYRRITEQRSMIKHFIASTTDELETTRDKNIIGDVAVNIGRERLRTEACSLYMVFGNEIELTNSTYLKNTSYLNRRKPIKAEVGSGLSSWVAATQKPLYFNSQSDYQKHPGWAGETEQLKFLPSESCMNLLLVPIMGHTKKCLGVLSFENKIEQGRIGNFSTFDIQAAINLAEELGLSLGLAQQLNNARELDQQMLEDDLHELKNQFYYGVQAASDNALYWLRQKKYKKAEKQLEVAGDNSVTILDELYTLHNTVKRKYYEIENFRNALNLIVDTFLHTFVGKDLSYENKRARIKIICPRNIHLTPLLRYTFIRIVSGALMNSIKHSGFLDNPEVEIKISVSQDDGHIQLVIQDNGCGIKNIRPGYGIGRMKDLIRFMKSKGFDVKLFIDSTEEAGTSVNLIAGLVPMEA